MHRFFRRFLMQQENDGAGSDLGGGAETPAAAETPAEPSALDVMRAAIEGAEPDDAPAASESVAAAQRARDELGRFAPGTAGQQQPAAAAQPGDAAAADPTKPPATPAAPAAPDDPLRPPEGLTPPAQERFQKLAGMVRERDAEIAPLKEAVEGFRELITTSGLDDAGVMNLFDYARAVTSGDVPRWEQMLTAQLENFRLATGRTIGAPDPLAAYPDLQAAVQGGQATPEIAAEIARSREIARRQQAAVAQHQQAQQSQAQQSQAFEQQVSSASQAVSTLVADWQATDLDWPKKQALLVTEAQEIAKTLPPAQWAGAVQRAYRLISQSVATLAPPPAPRAADPQPMRASGQIGGARTPQNMGDAIKQSLGLE